MMSGMEKLHSFSQYGLHDSVWLHSVLENLCLLDCCHLLKHTDSHACSQARDDCASVSFTGL